MDWYNQVVQLLSAVSQPLTNLYYSSQIPIISALLLGIIGALAPCQISSNLGAITFTTNRMTHNDHWHKELISYFLGKTLVYFLLGALVFVIGQQLETLSIPVFQVTKKLMGPLFVITGLYLVGLMKIKGIFTERLLKYQGKMNVFTGNKRGFLLGVILSLGFCPTMFLLFFGLLMPLVISTSGYGFILPILFSLGTFVPVLLFLGFSYGFGFDRSFIKRTKKVGKIIQIVSGILLVLMGIIDVFLYWALV